MVQEINLKIGNLHRGWKNILAHKKIWLLCVVFLGSQMNLHWNFSMQSKATCLLCLPVPVGCKYFSRPSKEHIPEIGRT